MTLFFDKADGIFYLADKGKPGESRGHKATDLNRLAVPFVLALSLCGGFGQCLAGRLLGTADDIGGCVAEERELGFSPILYRPCNHKIII